MCPVSYILQSFPFSDLLYYGLRAVKDVKDMLEYLFASYNQTSAMWVYVYLQYFRF
jgi:hypothetical protein